MRIIQHSKDKKRKTMPLLSWDFYASHLQKLTHSSDDAMYLEKFLKDKVTERNIEPAKAFSQYDAIVITNKYKVIKWVSSGFYFMTGYNKSEAINNSPNFLQGEKTSLNTKEEIRKLLDLKKPLSAELINYNKSGDIYNCRIEILPVKNDQDELTHFIALEKEIPLA